MTPVPNSIPPGGSLPAKILICHRRCTEATPGRGTEVPIVSPVVEARSAMGSCNGSTQSGGGFHEVINIFMGIITIL
jgi:hypothetical protein